MVSMGSSGFKITIQYAARNLGSENISGKSFLNSGFLLCLMDKDVTSRNREKSRLVIDALYMYVAPFISAEISPF